MGRKMSHERLSANIRVVGRESAAYRWPSLCGPGPPSSKDSGRPKRRLGFDAIENLQSALSGKNAS